MVYVLMTTGGRKSKLHLSKEGLNALCRKQGVEGDGDTLKESEGVWYVDGAEAKNPFESTRYCKKCLAAHKKETKVKTISMKKTSLLQLLVVIACVLVVYGCTQNQKAKGFGGKATVMLEPGRKLVTATWKDDNLWYLTRPAKAGEAADTCILQEESSFGVWEGTYIIIEQVK